MRAYLPDYEIRSPRNLIDVLSVLRDEPGVWRPFAGGTDLMVLFESGKLSHKKFLSIWHLPELKGFEESSTHITLGALTTYSEIQKNKTMQLEFPMLCQAASETGAIAIQNRGTIGGNIANASPAADSPPALLVYEAEIELLSAAGSRWVPYRTFHTAYKKSVMRPDELLQRVRIPRIAKEYTHFYRKVGTRKAQAISKVCIAGLARVETDRVLDIRIAFGSVAPTVIRCPQTESFLNGIMLSSSIFAQARLHLEKDIAPISDIRSTADFRIRVAGNLLEEFLKRL